MITIIIIIRESAAHVIEGSPTSNALYNEFVLVIFVLQFFVLVNVSVFAFVFVLVLVFVLAIVPALSCLPFE